MNFLARLFRRPTAIRDASGLMEFVEANAAFVVQKGIYEYARARAGPYARVLFGELEFQRTVNISRWRAYPLGLAMVGEVASVVLQQQTSVPRRVVVGAVRDIVLAVFDRWDVPAALDEAEWRGLRADLAASLDRIALHPPKRAIDIPEPFAEKYFDLMPIHKSLRGRDFPTLRSYLKVTLCNVHDDLTKRIDANACSIWLGS